MQRDMIHSAPVGHFLYNFSISFFILLRLQAGIIEIVTLLF